MGITAEEGLEPLILVVRSELEKYQKERADLALPVPADFDVALVYTLPERTLARTLDTDKIEISMFALGKELFKPADDFELKQLKVVTQFPYEKLDVLRHELDHLDYNNSAYARTAIQTLKDKEPNEVFDTYAKYHALAEMRASCVEALAKGTAVSKDTVIDFIKDYISPITDKIEQGELMTIAAGNACMATVKAIKEDRTRFSKVRDCETFEDYLSVLSGN